MLWITPWITINKNFTTSWSSLKWIYILYFIFRQSGGSLCILHKSYTTFGKLRRLLSQVYRARSGQNYVCEIQIRLLLINYLYWCLCIKIIISYIHAISCKFVQLSSLSMNMYNPTWFQSCCTEHNFCFFLFGNKNLESWEKYDKWNLSSIKKNIC